MLFGPFLKHQRNLQPTLHLASLAVPVAPQRRKQFYPFPSVMLLVICVLVLVLLLTFRLFRSTHLSDPKLTPMPFVMLMQGQSPQVLLLNTLRNSRLLQILFAQQRVLRPRDVR